MIEACLSPANLKISWPDLIAFIISGFIGCIASECGDVALVAFGQMGTESRIAVENVLLMDPLGVAEYVDR
ncbi:hypothetical protein SynA1544_01189 [Synechococcus sp. A15-44]|nr:hypothetical protein SynA1544_01189 [Synechococcus sp. A15-44]